MKKNQKKTKKKQKNKKKIRLKLQYHKFALFVDEILPFVSFFKLLLCDQIIVFNQFCWNQIGNIWKPIDPFKFYFFKKEKFVSIFLHNLTPHHFRWNSFLCFFIFIFLFFIFGFWFFYFFFVSLNEPSKCNLAWMDEIELFFFSMDVMMALPQSIRVICSFKFFKLDIRIRFFFFYYLFVLFKCFGIFSFDEDFFGVGQNLGSQIGILLVLWNTTKREQIFRGEISNSNSQRELRHA